MIEPSAIFPITHLSEQLDLQTYHLLLAHSIGPSAPETIQRLAAIFCGRALSLGHTITLDNSTHEFGSSPLTFIQLVEVARRLKIQEVVVPDVLFNGYRTIASLAEALSEMDSSIAFTYPGQTIMIVPQGRTFDEWMFCLHTMVVMLREQYRILNKAGFIGVTIGVTKDYEEIVCPGGTGYGLISTVDYAVRISQLLEAAGLRPRIHLLGWGRQHQQLRDLFMSKIDLSLIRSIDSAKPAVYGYTNVEFDPFRPDKIPPYPGRPENYFEVEFTQDQLRKAKLNVKTWQSWIKDLAVNRLTILSEGLEGEFQ